MNFFLCLGIIMLGGGVFGYVLKLIKLPSLIGYLALGILMGYFGLMNEQIAALSSELRKIALVIILLKAGLSLNLKDLKKVGRPAILLSILPCCLEMATVGIVAHYLLGLTFVESFILGSVLGAVSPAVVVPRMAKMLDEKQGTKEGVPQMVIAGAALDDIVMIVFFTSFMTIEGGGSITPMTILNVPISIVSGIAVGIGLGFLLSFIFKHLHMRDSLKLILTLGVIFGLVFLETFLAKWFSYSSLLSAITIGIVLLLRRKEQATRMAAKCEKIWQIAEIFLFVLVGASIQIKYALNVFGLAVAVIFIGLVVRFLAAYLATIKTGLSFKERSFVSISYLPKATVQAAIGGGLLDLGNELGKQPIIDAGIVVLSVAVVSILITAPLGAILMDLTYKKLTKKEENVCVCEK